MSRRAQNLLTNHTVAGCRRWLCGLGHPRVIPYPSDSHHTPCLCAIDPTSLDEKLHDLRCVGERRYAIFQHQDKSSGSNFHTMHAGHWATTSCVYFKKISPPYSYLSSMARKAFRGAFSQLMHVQIKRFMLHKLHLTRRQPSKFEGSYDCWLDTTIHLRKRIPCKITRTYR